MENHSRRSRRRKSDRSQETALRRVAIIFIIIIALAGLGKVVVMALGGDRVVYPPGSTLVFPADASIPVRDASRNLYSLPTGNPS